MLVATGVILGRLECRFDGILTPKGKRGGGVAKGKIKCVSRRMNEKGLIHPLAGFRVWGARQGRRGPQARSFRRRSCSGGLLP